MTDPIADMFVRIQNASLRQKPEVVVPFSRLKQDIAELLKRSALIEDFTKKGKKVKKSLIVKLSYENGQSVISGWKRISKPGVRIYASYKDIKPVQSGFGMAIISTSAGVRSDKEARRQKVGGEVLVEIW
ncbi:30S ribosomal protein S8 [Patescibacteria group bacterium]|nr:30S ribosomal protein S8 [Patescibacteria group bacterium]